MSQVPRGLLPKARNPVIPPERSFPSLPVHQKPGSPGPPVIRAPDPGPDSATKAQQGEDQRVGAVGIHKALLVVVVQSDQEEGLVMANRLDPKARTSRMHSHSVCALLKIGGGGGLLKDVSRTTTRMPVWRSILGNTRLSHTLTSLQKGRPRPSVVVGVQLPLEARDAEDVVLGDWIFGFDVGFPAEIWSCKQEWLSLTKKTKVNMARGKAETKETMEVKNKHGIQQRCRPWQHSLAQ